MAVSSHQPPSSPDDWVMVAKRELSNLSGSYRGQQSNDAKVDHALKAIEAALKAVIWKREKWPEWPKKGNKKFKYLYTHSLDAMLDQSGLRARLRADAALWASWQVLINALEKQSRYSPNPPSDAEANEVAKSTRHPDSGVVPWLLLRYSEMT